MFLYRWVLFISYNNIYLFILSSRQGSSFEETINTLKYADRAKQILVKVQANAVSAADDRLVLKLQKEVQHLKDILNLNRRGGVLDVNQQLLALKAENSRLKDAAGRVELVERLKVENRSLRLEMQELRAGSTGGGAFALGYNSGVGGYGAPSEGNADT